jgi:hypothetical protein
MQLAPFPPLPVPTLANLLVFDLEILLFIHTCANSSEVDPPSQVAKVERIQTPSLSSGSKTFDEARPTLRILPAKQGSQLQKDTICVLNIFW